MTRVVDLQDVAINNTALNARPPLLTPPIPTTTPYAKVLYYDDVKRVWSINIRYAILCLRRRLVSLAPKIDATIKTVVQWGEFFSIDGAETIYYVRSNPTTRVGYYDGDNTIIEAAGPGAFVSRSYAQVINGDKTITADTLVGKDLAVLGDLNPVKLVVDCGKYTGTPDVITPPNRVTTVTVSEPYNASVSWTAAVSAMGIKMYIVQVAELCSYNPAISLTAHNSLLPQVSSADGFNWISVKATSGSTTNAEIKGLKPGFIYGFRVAAITKNGDLVYSTDSTTTVMQAVCNPPSPLGIEPYLFSNKQLGFKFGSVSCSTGPGPIVCCQQYKIAFSVGAVLAYTP